MLLLPSGVACRGSRPAMETKVIQGACSDIMSCCKPLLELPALLRLGSVCIYIYVYTALGFT